MKFNEKLQFLRKEKHLSQEALADMLNVSRQSVSKWESGQAYPEMEKLVALCKIFNCKLDDLTNDEVDETEILKKKNHFDIVVSTIVDFINDSINAIKNMSFREIVRLTIEMVLVIICLAIIKIPAGYINDAVQELLFNFGRVGHFLANVFESIVNLAAVIFVILVLFYSFKKRCTDRFSKINTNEEVIVKMNEKEVKKEEVREAKSDSLESFTYVVLILVKIFVGFISIPALFTFISLCFGFGMSIVMLLEGILYFFIPLGILGCLMLNIIYLDIVIRFIASKKISAKNILITFGLSILMLVLATSIGAREITNTKYLSDIPEKYTSSLTTKEEIYDMQDDLMVHGNIIEYVPDESLSDKVKVEISYYDKYTSAKIEKVEKNIFAEEIHLNNNQIKSFIKLVKETFREKKLFDYSELFNIKIRITTSSSNIAKIEENINKGYVEEMEYEMNSIEKQLEEQEIAYDNLQEENEKLQEENQELRSKLDTYNETLKSLTE